VAIVAWILPPYLAKSIIASLSVPGPEPRFQSKLSAFRNQKTAFFIKTRPISAICIASTHYCNTSKIQRL